MKKQTITAITILGAILFFVFFVHNNNGNYSPLTFGAGVHNLETQNLQAAKTLGIKDVRYDISWSRVEKTKGVYDYSFYDTGVNRFLNSSITPLLIIDYGNPLYITTPQWVIDYNAQRRFKVTYIPNDTAEFEIFKKGFGEYVYQTVLHYKGKLTYFEIWNEPWASGFWYPKTDAIRYTELLKEAYIRGKQANPDAQFLADVTTYSFTQTMYQYGAKDYFDIMSMHPYCGSWATDPSDYSTCKRMGDIARIRTLAKDYGDRDKEMWVTEMGIPSSACNETGGNCGPNNTLEFQSFFLNSAINSIKKDYPFITKFFWYDIKNDYPEPDKWSEANFGLFYYNYTIKPVGIEYQRIIRENT